MPSCVNEAGKMIAPLFTSRMHGGDDMTGRVVYLETLTFVAKGISICHNSPSFSTTRFGVSHRLMTPGATL